MVQKHKTTASKRYKWVGHIQVYFSDEEVIEAQAWLGDTTPIITTIVDSIVSLNTSLKITLDEDRGVYQFTLQPKEKTSAYYGYTLGFGHSDLARGIHISQYILEVLMDNDAIPLPDKQSINTW